MKRFSLLSFLLHVFFFTTLFHQTISHETIPITGQPHGLNKDSAPQVRTGLKRLSNALDSTRTIQPSQWSDALQHLLSFQRLSILHRFGPFGEEKDNIEMLSQIQTEVPELSQIYASPPLYVDFHNYILDSMDQIPPNLLLNTTITQLSTNIPFAKLNTLISEQKQHTTSLLNDITTPNTNNTDLTKIDLTKHGELVYSKQHAVYSIMKEHFPSSPYIRLEITGENDDLLRTWFETYAENHGLSFVLLKFSSFTRQLGYGPNRQKQTVLYLEPDILIQHGKHFHRLSQHGQNTGILLLIILFLIIGSQLGFQYWQQTHQSSYDIFIVFCLWLVPLGVALFDHFRRFIIIWWLYTATTVIVLSLLLIDINPLVNKFLQTLEFTDSTPPTPVTTNATESETQSLFSSSTTLSTTPTSTLSSSSSSSSSSQQYYIIPQRYIFSIVYKFFLAVHKIIMILLSISIIVFFLDIFGVFQALGLEPHMVGEMFKGHQATAQEVLSFVMFSLYGCFYSLYFGVLNRDIATIVIPQLTILSTRFKLSREAKKLEKAAQSAITASQTDHITTGSTIELSKLTYDTNDAVKQRGGGTKGPEIDSQWNSTNLGSILNDSTTSQDQPTGNDVESFFSTSDTALNNDNDAQSSTIADAAKHKSVSKVNSCGICHELLKSKQNTNFNGATSTSTSGLHNSSSTSDLPTIHEIRERLRQRSLYTHQSASSNEKLMNLLKRIQQSSINAVLFLITNIFFFFVEYSDKLTGGTGEVNLDSVTVIEGMYTINTNPSAQRNNRDVVDYEGDTSVLDQEDDTSGQMNFSTTGYASRANRYAGGQNDCTNTLTTNNDVVFQLPCGCYCHDICLRGFMLLGKHNICPGCRELSNLDVFVSPWDSLYDNYRNFLDSVKYCIAVNPLLLFIINILLYFFW